MARTLGKAAVVLLVTVAWWGCGGSYGGSSTAPSPTGSVPSSVTITIVGERGAQSFAPNPAPAGGQAVVFRNTDTVVHRVRLNDDSLDSGDIAPGATSRPLAMPAGGANYHCPIHPGMIGSVRPATGGDPPPCTDSYC